MSLRGETPTHVRLDESGDVASINGSAAPEPSTLDLIPEAARINITQTFNRLGLDAGEIHQAVAPLYEDFERASEEVRRSMRPSVVEGRLRAAHRAKYKMGIADHFDLLKGEEPVPPAPQKRGILFWRRPAAGGRKGLRKG